jgi:thiamine-monophosphate kinase
MNKPGGRLGEFELIARFFAPLSEKMPGAFGLRDDVALIDVGAGCQLVAKTDAVIAGVHFRLDDPPEDVARKALRVNLSDLASKGARPLGFLQAIALNDSIDDAYLDRYAAGLSADVAQFGVPLLGGDTTAGPGPFTIAITALGEIPRGNAILRSGAKPGDLLYVTGSIGDAALGLACLDGRLDLPGEADRAALAERYRVPLPRLALGQALRGIATAGLDISDGLVADAGHLATSSGVAVAIDRERIPLSAAARAAVNTDPTWWQSVLGGGDDYELILAIPPNRTEAAEAAATNAQVALTCIGRVTAGSGVAVLVDGQPVPIAVGGFTHR